MAFIKFKPISSFFNFYSRVNQEEVREDIDRFISKDEKVVICLKSNRDVGIFTNKRVVLVDKKGIKGFQRSIYVVEYESISSYILNINNFNCVIELITNSAHTMKLSLSSSIPLEQVYKIYKFITDRVIEE